MRVTQEQAAMRARPGQAAGPAKAAAVGGAAVAPGDPRRVAQEEHARPRRLVGMAAYVTRLPGCASNVLLPLIAETRYATPLVTSASIA